MAGKTAWSTLWEPDDFFMVSGPILHPIWFAFKALNQTTEQSVCLPPSPPFPIRQDPNFKLFIAVKALALTKSDRTEFEGLVESTVRRLVTSLENTKEVAFAIPFPKVCAERKADDVPARSSYLLAHSSHLLPSCLFLSHIGLPRRPCGAGERGRGGRIHGGCIQ